MPEYFITPLIVAGFAMVSLFGYMLYDMHKKGERLRDEWKTFALGFLIFILPVFLLGLGESYSDYQKKHPETKAPARVQAAVAAPEDKRVYAVNTYSLKFHYIDCTYAEQMRPSNRKELYTTRQELINNGYSPCNWCKP